MKELISAIVLLLGLFGVGYETKHFLNVIRAAALEKAARGLPPLTDYNRKLHSRKSGQSKRAQQHRLL